MHQLFSLHWLFSKNHGVFRQALCHAPADPDGLMASREFPGLLIDTAALTTGDLAKALARLA